MKKFYLSVLVLTLIAFASICANYATQKILDQNNEYGNDVLGTTANDYLPSISFKVLQENQAGYIKIDKLASLGRKAGEKYDSEIPPIIKYQPNGYFTYFFPTSSTVQCVSSKNYLFEQAIFDYDKDCTLVTGAKNLVSKPNKKGYFDLKSPNEINLTEWQALPYDGMFSVHLMKTNETDKSWVGFRAIEISNHVDARGYKYQNMIYPDVKIDKCYGTASGINDCWWDSQSSYIAMSYKKYSPDNDVPGKFGTNDNSQFTDLGPIIWPNTGYIDPTTNQRAKNAGLYHPTSIVGEDGYIYLFYKDNDQCMKTARAPISSYGRPGSWKNYYNGSFNIDSLPKDFAYNRIKDFLTVGGGKASCIFKDENHSEIFNQWMSVAKVKDTDYYLAAIERGNYTTNKVEVVLRLTRNFVKWSDPVTVYTADQAGTWGTGKYCYPTLQDKNGATNYEIDKSDFNLLGNECGFGKSYILWGKKLKLNFVNKVLR